MAVFVAGRAVQGLGGGLISSRSTSSSGRPTTRAAAPAVRRHRGRPGCCPRSIGPLVAGAGDRRTWAGAGSSSACCRFVARRAGAPAAGAAARSPSRPTRRRPGSPAAAWAAAGRRWASARCSTPASGSTCSASASPWPGWSPLVAGLRPLLPRGTVRARRGLPAVVAGRGPAGRRLLRHGRAAAAHPRPAARLQPDRRRLPLTAGAVGWVVGRPSCRAGTPTCPRRACCCGWASCCWPSGWPATAVDRRPRRSAAGRPT